VTGGPAGRDRPLRVDAARNRARILEATRVLVARDGADVAVADVAREAGVAVGTLYRHFATREDLVVAAVEARTADLTERLEAASAAARAGEDPAELLLGLVREIAEGAAEDRALKAAATAMRSVPATGEAAERGLAAVGGLLAAAQDAGGVRRDVTVQDLLVLLAAVPGRDVDPTARSRFVDVVLAGLRSSV
jgi:AcrR family transcriptional regulator